MKAIIFTALLIALVSCGDSSSIPAGYTEVSLSELGKANSEAADFFDFGAEAVIKIAADKFSITNLDFDAQVSNIYKRTSNSVVYYQFVASLHNSDGTKINTTFTVDCKKDEKSLFSFKYNVKVPSHQTNDNNIDVEVEIETETETETEVEVEVEVEVETETESSDHDNDGYVPIGGCYSAVLKQLIANGAKNVILADSKIPRAAYDLTEINTAEKKTENGSDYYNFGVVLKDAAKNVLKINYVFKVKADGDARVLSYKWWYNTTN